MAMQPLQIRLVEEDDVDVKVLLRGFQRQGCPPKVTVVHDGLEALEALRGREGQNPPRRPHLIITDLNLPRMNGLQRIQALHQDRLLRRSIIFVLSSSALDVDTAAAYNQHIAGYLLKSNLKEQAAGLLKLIESYRELVAFPPNERAQEEEVE
jgi:CheY-like chemotaxis protein